MPQHLQGLLATAGFLMCVGGAAAAILLNGPVGIAFVLVVVALAIAGDLVVIARRTNHF